MPSQNEVLRVLGGAAVNLSAKNPAAFGNILSQRQQREIGLAKEKRAVAQEGREVLFNEARIDKIKAENKGINNNKTILENGLLGSEYLSLVSDSPKKADSFIAKTVVDKKKKGEDVSGLMEFLSLDQKEKNRTAIKFVTLANLSGVTKGLIENPVLQAAQTIEGFQQLNKGVPINDILKSYSASIDKSTLEQRIANTPEGPERQELLKLLGTISDTKKGPAKGTTIRVVTNEDGTTTELIQGGAGSDLTIGQKGKMQDKLTTIRRLQSSLSSIAANLDPRRLTKQGKIAVGLANTASSFRINIAKAIKDGKVPEGLLNLAESLGFDRDFFSEEFQKDMSKFKSEVELLFQEYRIAITGVQAGFEELKQLKKNLLSTELSPPEFMARLQNLNLVMQRNTIIGQNLLKRGFGGTLEGVEEKFSPEQRKNIGFKLNSKIQKAIDKSKSQNTSMFTTNEAREVAANLREEELRKEGYPEAEVLELMLLEGW